MSLISVGYVSFVSRCGGCLIKFRIQKSLNGVEELQKLCGEAAVSILRAISRRTFLVYLALGLAKASYLTGEVVDLLGGRWSV